MFALVLAPALGWFLPRLWVLALAAAVPVVEMWLTSGLGAYDQDGYENWGLVVLPFLCAAAALLAALGLYARRRRDRRRGTVQPSL